MTDWRDIKSAPRDETTVLVSIAVDGDMEDSYVDMLYWYDHWWLRRSDEVLPSNHIATHWMPLPDPFKPPETEAKE